MIIKCDKCGTKFELADEKIGEKGVKVRCSKCKNVFTVKKSDSEKETKAPEQPPPQEQPESQSAAPPPKTEEDPFSDFSFNDDLDFSEGEEDVKMDDKPGGASVPPPPPESGGGDLLDDSPDISFKEADSKEEAPPEEDFDFPDADFDFSDDADLGDSSESAVASHPPAKAAGDFADTAGGDSLDDLGDISFDEDSFTETPPEPLKEGPGVDEYGNVSLSDADKEAEKPSGVKGLDEGEGDFHFGASAEGGSETEEEGMEMDLDDFVRSPKSRAPVSDDYEASIGESETDADTALPKQESKEPPPPPKPAVKKPAKAKSHGLRNTVIVLLVLALGLCGGGLAFTSSKGWFTFADLTAGNLDKLQQVPDKFMIEYGFKKIPLKGEVKINEDSFNIDYDVELQGGDRATIIRGEVLNDTNKMVSSISVEVPLLDPRTEEVLTKPGTNEAYKIWSFCGKNFSKEEFKNYSKTGIELEMHDDPDKTLSPGQSCSFMLVVPNVIDAIEGNVTLSLDTISIREWDIESDPNL
ncbi:MAG: zinc-ribbon domain-containing protein [bacterium]